MGRVAVRAFLLVLLLATLVTGLASHRVLRAARRPSPPPPRLSPFPALHSGARILIVSPHPDDETLGCAGLIQQALAAGAQVDIAIVTNGDASELALIFGEHELPLRPSAFQDLGRHRQQEALGVLARLGVKRDRIHFLGYPNNGLLALWRPEHWPRNHPYRSPYTKVSSSPYRLTFTPRAPYAGQQVLADLVKLMAQVRPTEVFVTHPQDVHPDHWSTASFTLFALGLLSDHGVAWARQTHVYGFLIHWPGYPVPRKLRPGADLRPPVALTTHGERWLMLPLTGAQQKRKLAAIRSYRSQLPAFDRLLLAFDRKNELFEEITPARAARGGVLAWSDEDTGVRRLGGAEVLGVRLRVEKGAGVVDIDTRSAPIPKNGYLGFDVRTYGGQAGARISTAYVGAKSVRGSGVDARGDVHPLLVTSHSLRTGVTQLSRLPLPTGESLPRRFFVTCWGSVRDRVTDPAVNARVEQ